MAMNDCKQGFDIRPTKYYFEIVFETSRSADLDTTVRGCCIARSEDEVLERALESICSHRPALLGRHWSWAIGGSLRINW
jgi:hypothetical protein